MKKFISYAAMAMTLYACSNNDVTTPEIIDPQNATLSISTSVSNSIAKTRTTSNGTNLSDAAGTGPVMGISLASGSQIGVFVYNASTTSNYNGTTANTVHKNLLWTNNGVQNWSFTGDYYLGNAHADIHAYFPYSTANNDTHIIPVESGYTDFLYGKSSNIVHLGEKAANIVLNHALAMVTFTFENTGYSGPSKLQSITLNNLPKSGTLDITNGEIASPTSIDTLKINKYDGSNYIDANAAQWATSFATNKIGGTTINGEEAAAGMFHAMVLPQESTDVNAYTATIVIDGVSHNISLKVNTNIGDNNSDWKAGKNYTYNLKLSGNNQLEVSSVTVTQWQEGGSSDIEI